MPTQVAVSQEAAGFAADVRKGLHRKEQKELPSKYLYDAIGSALFEAISLLPEYGVTRADERLLRVHAAEIVERIPSPLQVAELGSGTGKKTRWLLQALCRRQPTSYFPIEISRAALAMCRRQLSDIDSIHILGFEREYLDGLEQVARERRDGQRILVLFLGSTIGNFDRPRGLEFLAKMRRILKPGDFLLLGTDLEKPIRQLLQAYDDRLGITAAFNRNLLGRINRELDGDFELEAFEHVARYEEKERRIEMHLRARSRQTVFIRKADLRVTIGEGETIWTESSHKYLAEDPFRMARATGFACTAQWIDAEWPFAENLLIAQ
ncbi:MAG TPA: L-histidine N(alpha)-methyltransferase [Patescibacteria group bacterium]|nr:L-histidine N(alpha)-methyltransferase [Patescibacteria group bacterium]